jgi:hypothetical protein
VGAPGELIVPFFHRRQRAPRASQVDIQVLEHDVYGEEPPVGSAAALVLGLRALGAAGTSSREMMHAMSECTATGTIRIGTEDIVVICNLRPHEGEQHHDIVHGDWNALPDGLDQTVI